MSSIPGLTNAISAALPFLENARRQQQAAAAAQPKPKKKAKAATAPAPAARPARAGMQDERRMLREQYQSGFGGQLSDKRAWERYRNRVAQLDAIEKQKARQELYRSKTRERVAANKAAKAAKATRAATTPTAAPTASAASTTAAPQSTQPASPVNPPAQREMSRIAELPTTATPAGRFNAGNMISDLVARAREAAARTPTGQLATLAAPAPAPAPAAERAPFDPAQAGRSLTAAAGRSLNPVNEPLTANLNVEGLSGRTDAESAPISLGSLGQAEGTLLDLVSRIPGLGIQRPERGFSAQAADADVAERNAADDAVRSVYAQASAGLDPNTASGKAEIGNRLGQILSAMPNGPIGSPEKFARDKLVLAFVKQYPNLAQIAYPSAPAANINVNDQRYADLIARQQSLAPGSVAGGFSMNGQTDFERAASSPTGTIGPTPQLPAGTPQGFGSAMADAFFGPGGAFGAPLPPELAAREIARATTQAERDAALARQAQGQMQGALLDVLGGVGVAGPRGVAPRSAQAQGIVNPNAVPGTPPTFSGPGAMDPQFMDVTPGTPGRPVTITPGTETTFTSRAPETQFGGFSRSGETMGPPPAGTNRQAVQHMVENPQAGAGIGVARRRGDQAPAPSTNKPTIAQDAEAQFLGGTAPQPRTEPTPAATTTSPRVEASPAVRDRPAVVESFKNAVKAGFKGSIEGWKQANKEQVARLEAEAKALEEFSAKNQGKAAKKADAQRWLNSPEGKARVDEILKGTAAPATQAQPPAPVQAPKNAPKTTFQNQNVVRSIPMDDGFSLQEVRDPATGNQGSIAMYQDRPVIFVEVDGRTIPFYRSSSGTDGKRMGDWYPFGGVGPKGWLIKQDIKGMNEGTGLYSSPGIQKASEWLNSRYGAKAMGEAMKADNVEPQIDVMAKYVMDRMTKDLGLKPAESGRALLPDPSREGRRVAYERVSGLINRGALGRDLPMQVEGTGSTITNEFPLTMDQVTDVLKEVFGLR